MIDRLFVYGTLAPGRPNEHVLANVPGSWVPATVGGTLVHAGWGADVGFPAIIIDDAGERVGGFVFSSELLAEHWARLDDFEGDGYARVLALATLEDGSVVDAYVYALRQDRPAMDSSSARDS
jgi:gamma-glutamylcyclotransferase (GGCT)/AIG2-like uncharacterized protein YtfP